MKRLLLLFVFLVSESIWSQDLETRIQQVENGLTLQAIVPKGKPIPARNILEKLREHKIHGASVAVVHNGKIDWLKTYGVTDAESANAVTTQTLFQSASIGKVITALAALKLVEEGKLELDENVNTKLKSWKLEENENTKVQAVTLRHLLSHSAGLTDNYGFLGYDPKDRVPTLLQILRKDPLANTKKSLAVKRVPGTVEEYSGGGYLIIQLLIEELSGIPFEAYVQQHIFDPLDMTRSTYHYRPDTKPENVIAAGHRSNGKSLKNKKYHIYPEKGAAGPWTTAEDLAKLLMGIQKAYKGKANSILSRELMKEFMTPQINTKGLGVNLKGLDVPKAFWHAGQNLGYTALFYGLTEEEGGAVVLLNSDGGEKLMQAFITSVALAYDWPVMKSYTTMETPPEFQVALTGTYQNSSRSKDLFITQKKGKLIVQSSGARGSFQLYRIGENHYTFKDTQDYYKLSFTFENGKVVSLIYTESIGKTVVLKKTD